MIIHIHQDCDAAKIIVPEVGVTCLMFYTTYIIARPSMDSYIRVYIYACVCVCFYFIGAGFKSLNPTERWLENPETALALAGFSQHLQCGIHRSEPSRVRVVRIRIFYS